MNDNLQNAVSKIIEGSLSAIDKAKTFLEAEIPDVVYQLLLWHGVKSFIYFAFGVILCFIVIYFNYKQYKWISREINKDKDFISDTPELAFNLFQLFWGIPFALLLNIQWLQILIAPKVWLIEYAAKLIK